MDDEKLRVHQYRNEDIVHGRGSAGGSTVGIHSVDDGNQTCFELFCYASLVLIADVNVRDKKIASLNLLTQSGGAVVVATYNQPADEGADFADQTTMSIASSNNYAPAKRGPAKKTFTKSHLSRRRTCAAASRRMDSDGN
jgi:hypothetical protein